MSFEQDIQHKITQNQPIPDRVNLSVLRYFWQASPLSGGGGSVIPKFLRKIAILKNFSDNELRILSHSLHHRHFTSREVVFNHGDHAVGFYFIFSGQVAVFTATPPAKAGERTESNQATAAKQIVTLEKGDYFGEIALLQKHATRTATAIATENTKLLGIFKPDMEQLIENHPPLAAKLLLAISTILTHRISAMAEEMRDLKHKVHKLKTRQPK